MTATGKNTPYEVTSTKLIGGKRLYYVKQGFNEWTGYSVKEALAKRENDINAFLDQRSDSAICLRVAPDEYMIGYLTIGGWMVRFVHGQSKADHNGEILSLNGHIAGKDRRECERSMRCHAAHLDIKFGPYYGIKTDLDVLSLTQDERAHAVLKLASLNFGWIDYTKDVDRYHKTLPFIAGQRFTAFTFQVRRLETVSRNFYDKYKKIDYFVEPFGVDEPDHDFHFKLMKDIKDVSKQEYRSRRFNALSSRSRIS
jgi:hypothetical protein